MLYMCSLHCQGAFKGSLFRHKNGISLTLTDEARPEPKPPAMPSKRAKPSLPTDIRPGV